MNISRSGYYKWKKNKYILNQYEQNRKDYGELAKEIHKRKPSYGYRRINSIILKEHGWKVSDNFAHKVCHKLKIYSKAKHYKIKKVNKDEEYKFDNLIGNNWETKRPFEKVATDTTKIVFKNKSYDWNYYIDAFNGEIIGSDIRQYCYGGGYMNHKKSLEDMLRNKEKRGYKDQKTILHSDQGPIYTSALFNNAYKDYNIIRSMSRPRTPTDNAIIESKNGWLKKEIVEDFNQYDYQTVEEYINAIIRDNNEYRPSARLKYKTPVEYRTQLGFK